MIATVARFRISGIAGGPNPRAFAKKTVKLILALQCGRWRGGLQ
jgi:hypothetical protein